MHAYDLACHESIQIASFWREQIVGYLLAQHLYSYFPDFVNVLGLNRNGSVGNGCHNPTFQFVQHAFIHSDLEAVWRCACPNSMVYTSL